MKILITGSNGFTGYHLIHFLQLKYHKKDIWGIDISSSEKSSLLSDHFICCDMKDSNALSNIIKEIKPDWIFHLAGQIGSSSYSLLFKENVSLTIKLLEVISSLQLFNCRILVISSSAVYGTPKSQKTSVVNENSPTNPVSWYGITKLIIEKVALKYFLTHDIKIIIARPFNLIGKGVSSRLFIGKVFQQLNSSKKNNNPIKVGYVGSKRDYIDIRDTVLAYELLLSTGIPGEIYNIGSGKSLMIRDILNMIIRASGLKVKWQETIKAPLKNDIPDLIADYTKIQSLGWKPSFKVEDSVRWIFS